MKNFLAERNCNKAMCKSCIFRTDGNQITLSEERMAEIMGYLQGLTNSHICHNTNKTCYGALTIQAQTMFKLGIIPDNSVQTMLITAKAILNL